MMVAGDVRRAVNGPKACFHSPLEFWCSESNIFFNFDHQPLKNLPQKEIPLVQVLYTLIL